MVSEEQAKKDGRYDEDLNYHDLGKQKFLEALNSSEEPIMVIVPREGNRGIMWNRLLLVTNQTDSNNNNIVVVQKIQTSANIENKTVKSNKIVTAYGKDTLQNQIKEAGSDNRILYLNKNKSQLSGNVGEGRSPAGYTKIDFDNNVKQFWENFNYLRNKKSVNKDLSKSLEESKGHLFDGIDTSNLLKHSLKVKTESNTDLKSLKKENSYLKRKVEGLKEEFKLTKGYEPNPADVSRVANRLKVDLKSTYDRQALKDNLTKIFKYINEYNGENTAEVMQVSANLAKDLLQQSKGFTGSISPELKDVRQAIKSYDLKLSSQDLSDLEVLGGYNNVRRHFFRKIALSKTKGIIVVVIMTNNKIILSATVVARASCVLTDHEKFIWHNQ